MATPSPPAESSTKKAWKDWEVRVLVLTSLCLQIILIFAAGQRKRIASRLLIFVLWSAYLLADWVATYALGTLSYVQIPGHKQDLFAFWCPFLLLHLGGPDTITSFALEDNELWLRHLLGLLVQVSLAIYVYFKSNPSKKILAPAILMFAAGIIKYVERTWSLWKASMNSLRSSMVKEPDPGPNYANFMDDYDSKFVAGIQVKIETESEYVRSTFDWDARPQKIDRYEILSQAHHFLKTFRRLVVDLILTSQDRAGSQLFFLKLLPEDAFEVVEVELAFLYELLHTKAPVVRTKSGPFIRLLTFLLILTALVLFCHLADDRQKHGIVDTIITYVLLGGGLALETFAILMQLLSEWASVQYDMISCCLPPRMNKSKWSNYMSQFNLLTVCLNDRLTAWNAILKFFGQKENWQKLWYTKREIVPPILKELIFTELREKVRMAEVRDGYKTFSACKGDWVLQESGYSSQLSWSIKDVEFDKSILIWHIATDLCYHDDDRKTNRDVAESNDRLSSKLISDYMIFLLVVQPFMLTDAGIGQIRYDDTCAEAKKFFQRVERKLEAANACEMLLEVATVVAPKDVKGDRSQSALFDGCMLAKSLMELGDGDRWRVISTVWVEMMCYAATKCRGNFHAKKLSSGGELLTHVWFLMAHLGIGEQYRVEEGNARAKLIVKKDFADIP